MNSHSLKIANLKKELRAQFREKRLAIPAKLKKQRDEAICSYAINMAAFRYAECVLMYAPTKYEIDVMPIAEEAMRKGKKVFFPKCNKETKTMTYRLVSSLDELIPDVYGIDAPPETATAYDPNDKATTLCLIPGLTYDKSGYRVGYGGGYYDRFLADFKGCKAGVIYNDFIISSVPRGHFDYKVDIMLTEKNVRIPVES